MKAILILDVPEKLVGEIGDKLSIVGEEYNVDWKLRPLPQRKLEGNWGREAYGWNACLAFAEGCCQGWNDCLDEITGDAK